MKRLSLLAASVLALSTASVAQAAVHVFGAPLAAEAPTVSAGTGYATVTIDDVIWSMRVKADFSNLTGVTTVAHIHCCLATAGVGTVGVATQTPSFTGFPVGVTAGSYDTTFDLNLASSWNGAFIMSSGGISQAQTRLLDGLKGGKAYLNVHTSFAPGGEIRAELVAVPEPSTWAMMIGGFGLVGYGLRRTARRAATA